jgi:uncharacterized protein (TIGR00255 family)
MKSMTGFGEGEAGGAYGHCTVQIQSVNSRYFKLTVNLPREIASLEPAVRRYLQGRVGRGQVTAYVLFTPAEGGLERVAIDRKACKELAGQLKKVGSWLGLEGGLDLATLVRTGAIVKSEMANFSKGPVWGLVRKGFEAACDDLEKNQAMEGRMITRDFIARWRRVESFLGRIDGARPQSSRRYEEKIRKKVRTILEGAHYDEGRLLAEVSIFADRVDITEEIVRLRSHLKHFRRLLSAGGEVGKKLDFTIQEILREVNTAANKANDALISRLAIEIKAEIEKIREQLQNVQ